MKLEMYPLRILIPIQGFIVRYKSGHIEVAVTLQFGLLANSDGDHIKPHKPWLADVAPV